MASRAELKDPETPMLEKLRSVRHESQQIGEFLEWLEHQGIHLMTYGEGDELSPDYRGVERLLADYFEIDLVQVEKERQALLEWQQKLNEVNDG